MKWSMIQLQKFRDKGLTIEEVVNFDQLKERDPQVRHVSPIKIQAQVDIGSKRVTFHLHITGELILPSSRTLRDVRFPLTIQSTETFQYERKEEDVDSEEEIHLIKGEMIDLTPIVEELIMLEIPMQIFGEDEQMPASFQSGKGWEFIQDEEQLNKEEIDPRLAKLSKLLKKEDEK